MGARVAPVSLALGLQGTEQVKAALRGVKASFVEMERDSLAATRAASKERIALLQAESKEKISLLHKEAAARRETARSERDFKRTLGRKDGDPGLGAAGRALVKGDGFDSVLRAAGVAGIAVNLLSGAINFASASLKQFASFVINDVIKPGLALETRAVQIANNSGGALTAKDVQSRAKAIGLANNMDPTAVLDAMGRFQDLTGEPGLGLAVMPTVGAISKGRGYDPKALSELAAATYRPGMKVGDLNQLLMTLTGQGEKGSIPIGELARLGGRLTAPAEKLGGDWFTKVTTANALLQTAKRTGFGTVDSAAEGLEHFTQDAFLKGRRLSPKSFATVNGVDTMIDPVKYLGDIFRKTRGAPAALHGLGFSEPAQRFVGAYQGVFSEGYAGAKAAGKGEAEARDAGAAAVEAFVNTMKTATSTMAAEEARRDSVMETSGEKLEAAFERIKDRVSEVLPQIEEFADMLLDNADDIGEAAKVIVEALLEVAKVAKFIADPFGQQDSAAGKYAQVLFDPVTFVMNELGDDGAPAPEPTDAAAKKRRRGRHGAEGDQGEAGRRLDVGDQGELQWQPGDAVASYAPAEPAPPESIAAEAPAEDAGAAAASDAHEQLASDAAEASEAICKLTTCVQGLSAAMNDLPRNQSFGKR